MVNIGTRQHGRTRGENVIDVSYSSEAISNGINNRLEKVEVIKQSAIYGEGNSGEKIANILADIKLRFHKTISY